MHRHTAAFLAISALLLTACTAAPEPAPSTGSPSPAASVDPIVETEVITVGAAEKPPIVFDGDCTPALDAAELSAVIGVELSPVEPWSGGNLGNVGGLRCGWENGPAAVRIDIVPFDALGDAAFTPEEEQFYFIDCEAAWVCAAVAESEHAVALLSFQSIPTATRERVDLWGAQIGATVLERFEESAAPRWQRDRTGWWEPLDCIAVTERVGEQLGMPLDGQTVGYHDPPAPGVVLADQASNWSSCYMATPSGSIELYTSAGTAWGFPPDGVTEELETGVDGVAAFREPGFANSFVLSDGVNVATVYVREDPAWGEGGAARALAAVAATDWR